MRDLRQCLETLFAAVLVFGLCGAALAQERTTATYEDWTLQCELHAGPPAKKICDISQTAQLQGRPFSRVAIEIQGQTVRMVAQVPVNVSFRANARLQINNSEPVLTAPFDRCVAGGCFVEFELGAEAIKKLRAAGDGGKLTFRNAGGQDLTIPISFKGFGQAYDALMKG